MLCNLSWIASTRLKTNLKNRRGLNKPLDYSKPLLYSKGKLKQGRVGNDRIYSISSGRTRWTVNPGQACLTSIDSFHSVMPDYVVLVTWKEKSWHYYLPGDGRYSLLKFKCPLASWPQLLYYYFIYLQFQVLDFFIICFYYAIF